MAKTPEIAAKTRESGKHLRAEFKEKFGLGYGPFTIKNHLVSQFFLGSVIARIFSLTRTSPARFSSRTPTCHRTGRVP